MDATQLKDNEVVLLGLLSESPRYGYEIDKVIEERGLREWTDIAFSSIYAALTGLEKKGLAAADQSVSNGRVRKQYKITPAGKRALDTAVKELLAVPRRTTSELDLGVSLALGIERDQMIGCLHQRMSAIDAAIDDIRAKREAKAEGAPFFVKALFDRPIAHLQAEKTFVDGLLLDIEGVSPAIEAPVETEIEEPAAEAPKSEPEPPKKPSKPQRQMDTLF